VDWPEILRGLAIALAVLGGLAALLGALRLRGRSRVLHLASYLLMSLSVFFLALGGLLERGG